MSLAGMEEANLRAALQAQRRENDIAINKDQEILRLKIEIESYKHEALRFEQIENELHKKLERSDMDNLRLLKAMSVAYMNDFCDDYDGSLWANEFYAAMRNEKYEG